MEMKTIRRDRSISVTDMFLSVIQQWRILLGFFAIFAIIIGLIGTCENYINGVGIPETIIDSEGNTIINMAKIKKLEQMMTEEELDVADDLIATLKWYDGQIEHYRICNTESIFGQIDPDNIDTVTLQYFIGATGTEENAYEATSAAIGKVYLSVLSDDSIYEEMIDVVNADYTIDDYRDVIATDETEISKGIFKINVYGLDSEMASKMADVVEKYIKSKSDDAKEVYASHKLKLLSREQFVDGNYAFREKQLKYIYALQDIESYIPILKEKMNLTNTQSKYVELMQENEENADTTAEEVDASFISSIDIKSLIIGGIIGAFVAAIMLVVRYIASGRIHNCRDVENDFDLPVLCNFADRTTPMRKHSSKLDKWITKMRNSEKPALSADDAACIAVTKIEVLTKDNDITKIAFAIDSNVLASLVIVDKIADMLDNVKIICTAIDKNVLENIKTADGVIIVVQSELTQHDDINNIIENCRHIKTCVLGTIVAD